MTNPLFKRPAEPDYSAIKEKQAARLLAEALADDFLLSDTERQQALDWLLQRPKAQWHPLIAILPVSIPIELEHTPRWWASRQLNNVLDESRTALLTLFTADSTPDAHLLNLIKQQLLLTLFCQTHPTLAGESDFQRWTEALADTITDITPAHLWDLYAVVYLFQYYHSITTPATIEQFKRNLQESLTLISDVATRLQSSIVEQASMPDRFKPQCREEFIIECLNDHLHERLYQSLWRQLIVSQHKLGNAGIPDYWRGWPAPTSSASGRLTDTGFAEILRGHNGLTSQLSNSTEKTLLSQLLYAVHGLLKREIIIQGDAIVLNESMLSTVLSEIKDGARHCTPGLITRLGQLLTHPLIIGSQRSKGSLSGILLALRDQLIQTKINEWLDDNPHAHSETIHLYHAFYKLADNMGLAPTSIPRSDQWLDLDFDQRHQATQKIALLAHFNEHYSLHKIVHHLYTSLSQPGLITSQYTELTQRWDECLLVRDHDSTTARITDPPPLKPVPSQTLFLLHDTDDSTYLAINPPMLRSTIIQSLLDQQLLIPAATLSTSFGPQQDTLTLILLNNTADALITLAGQHFLLSDFFPASLHESEKIMTIDPSFVEPLFECIIQNTYGAPNEDFENYCNEIMLSQRESYLKLRQAIFSMLINTLNPSIFHAMQHTPLTHQPFYQQLAEKLMAHFQNNLPIPCFAFFQQLAFPKISKEINKGLIQRITDLLRDYLCFPCAAHHLVARSNALALQSRHRANQLSILTLIPRSHLQPRPPRILSLHLGNPADDALRLYATTYLSILINTTMTTHRTIYPRTHHLRSLDIRLAALHLWLIVTHLAARRDATGGAAAPESTRGDTVQHSSSSSSSPHR